MKATNGERGEEVNGRKKEQTLGRPTSAALAASWPVEAGRHEKKARQNMGREIM